MSLILLTGDVADDDAAAAISPEEVDNLFSWYSATDSVSGLSDNDPSGTINDLSGRAMHLDNGSPNPVYRTNQTPTGGPAFEFNGVTNSRVRYRLSFSTPPVPEFPQGPGSVFIVAKPLGSAVIQTMFSLGRSNFGNPPLRAISIVTLSGSARLRGFDLDTPGGSVDLDAWSLFEVHALPDTKLGLFANGEPLLVAETQPWFSDVAAVTTRRWTMGASYAAGSAISETFAGLVAEVVVYDDRLMLEAEREGVRNYLADKHGITLAGWDA